MSSLRRWGLPALLFCLPALALSAAVLRAADDNPPLDAKAVDALVHKTLRAVINEGADMYNAQGKYQNMERDYAGCYHLYEGALIAVRPLLAGHAELQKAIDDGLDNARDTPRMEMRAFVLREVIDKIRDGVNPNKAAAVPPVPPPPRPVYATTTGKAVTAENGKLTFKADGKDITVSVPAEAKVTIDGKDGKLEDVKKDSEVTVTAKDEVVFKVEAKTAPTAPPPPAPKTATVLGKVVGVDKDKLTVAVDEKRQVFTVPDSAKVVIDDKDGKLADVKADSIVTVVSKDDVVATVDVKSPPPPPPPAKEKSSTGKATKVEKGKLTVKGDDGKEATVPVPAEAKVMIDGKDGKLEDVKPDSAVTVTTKDEAVIKVEAKSPTAPPPPPPPPSGQTLWDRLGGETGVAKVVDDFVNVAVKDPKVNFYRDPTAVPSKEDVAALKKKLVEFVSKAAGGPLTYTGKDMKEAHKGMKITDAEFDAAGADLKAALEKNGVKADDVKAVMAAVEDTRKDIVEVKGSEDKPKPPEEKQPEDKKPADEKKNDDKPAESSIVSGKVTYKGKPLPGGVVALTTTDGAKTLKADITSEGSYTIKDVKAGAYKVTVDAEALNSAGKPNPAYVPAPAVYRNAKVTPLTFQVQKGEQTFDIDLK